MITPAYVQTMAAYNAEMNRRIYRGAAALTEVQRTEDRKLFFGSLHATLAHLIWGDRMWMSRFADWEKPERPLKDGPGMYPDFAEMRATRVRLDADLIAWSDSVTPEWLAQDLTWFSGAINRELTQPRALLVVHLFNHQTHHRGQAHAALTGFGHKTEDTDLPFVLP